eukprot:6602169-Alexandrium_andersonii.AAC.1
MSASLVGSEMCIRDSFKDHCSSRGPFFIVVAGPRQCLQVLRGSFKDPVSYTHLTLPTICSV